MDRQFDVEDAIQVIVRFMKSGPQGGYSSYGYGVYLPNVMRNYLKESGIPEPHTQAVMESQSDSLWPVFYAAGWELCRRGILRPGIKNYRGQATADGASGNGYSVTPFGEKWLREADGGDYAPVEPGRFAKMLADNGQRFGPGFAERAQEAVRAYNTHAFLAACAMCGAAAESIILALAVGKTGDEKKVLDQYVSGGGRGRVEKIILGGQPELVQDEFHRYITLLKYWRDSAAHGRAVAITETEAYSSLSLLLRFAIFASDRWDQLTVR
jgi:hypothetical protein